MRVCVCVHVGGPLTLDHMQRKSISHQFIVSPDSNVETTVCISAGTSACFHLSPSNNRLFKEGEGEGGEGRGGGGEEGREGGGGRGGGEGRRKGEGRGEEGEGRRRGGGEREEGDGSVSAASTLVYTLVCLTFAYEIFREISCPEDKKML